MGAGSPVVRGAVYFRAGPECVRQLHLPHTVARPRQARPKLPCSDAWPARGGGRAARWSCRQSAALHVHGARQGFPSSERLLYMPSRPYNASCVMILR